MCFAINKISKRFLKIKLIEECQGYTDVHVMSVQDRRACFVKRDKRNSRVIDPDS